MPQGKPLDSHKVQRWRQLIERWQHSGLSVRAFCQRHQLATPSFYNWRRRLRQYDGLANHETSAAAFLPIHVRPDDTDTRASVELVLANGRCLRIPRGFDAAHLREVLRTLEEFSC